MGYCENNVILFTNMPSTVTLNVYDEQGNLEEQRILTFVTYPEDMPAGIYYFNKNGRQVTNINSINGVNV